jgi:hypothetical protein
VTLRRAGARAIAYRVTFWRWTTYCVAIAVGVGAMLALMYFVPGVREKLASFPRGTACYFGLVGFWGLGWPWCLTAIHRPFARRLLERILRETIESRPHARRAA